MEWKIDEYVNEANCIETQTGTANRKVVRHRTKDALQMGEATGGVFYKRYRRP